MNNSEILEDYIDSLRNGKPFNYTNERKAQAVENLIQENKELKEKNNIMQIKIYNLQEDNIELLRKDGNTDKLNYKYVECPKAEAEWYKSESYIKDNFISKSKVKEKIEEAEKLKKEYEIDNTSFDEGMYDEIIAWLEELLEEGE